MLSAVPERSTSVYEEAPQRTAATMAAQSAVWPLSSYYLAECTTSQACTLLQHCDAGTFLIRPSQRHAPCLALSIVCANKVTHLLVQVDRNG